MNNYSFLLIFCSFLFFEACKNEEINDPMEYFSYVEDEKNGLFLKKEIKDLTFTLQYKPSAYMILSDNENLPIDEKSFSNEEKEYDKFQYYTLHIKVTSDTMGNDILHYKLTSEEAYTQRLHYFETTMQQDVKLICGDDTLSPASFLFKKETAPGICCSFLISFPTTAYRDMDRTFIYDNHALNTGKVIFTIDGEAIANTPLLNL